MKKFRKWLIDRFLPRWAYESLLEELAAANKKQEELRQTVERQQCYISGLEYALRHMTPTVVVESHEKETKEKAGEMPGLPLAGGDRLLPVAALLSENYSRGKA